MAAQIVPIRPFSPPKDTRLPDVPVISIVDDDESVRVAINRLVRSVGFVGHTFASADALLRSPHLNESACVIADVQMPGMNGLELQSVLLARGNDTPLIFITAFPDERIRAQVLEAGAVCLLSKPFDGPFLIQCIETAIKGHRGEA
jgi:FixJ family two-component response regulator